MTENGVVIDEIRLAALCQKWRIQRLAMFGSILCEDFRSDSDVDLLVEFVPDAPWSLYDLVDLRSSLAEMFDRKVDLVESNAIRNPYRRRSILSSQKVIYDAA
ncbi:MAG: nucleotidyltransferase domain-containing protein [Candidatus Riflebacteria bacterium]|nr:nucleotidyltransferase domain-containing protein [Candidatus Riflebacteria bacterium]